MLEQPSFGLTSYQRLFEGDLSTLEQFCKFAQPQISPVFEEFRHQFKSEFDYRREAANLRLVWGKVSHRRPREAGGGGRFRVGWMIEAGGRGKEGGELLRRERRRCRGGEENSIETEDEAEVEEDRDGESTPRRGRGRRRR
eukprot:761280-Hanusia_phi.AAC.1